MTERYTYFASKFPLQRLYKGNSLINHDDPFLERDTKVLERDRRDIFRDGPEGGQIVSSEVRTTANRFLSLRSVDFHYCYGFRG